MRETMGRKTAYVGGDDDFCRDSFGFVVSVVGGFG